MGLLVQSPWRKNPQPGLTIAHRHTSWAQLPDLSPPPSTTVDRRLCAEHPVPAHADPARCVRFAAR